MKQVLGIVVLVCHGRDGYSQKIFRNRMAVPLDVFQAGHGRRLINALEKNKAATSGMLDPTLRQQQSRFSIAALLDRNSVLGDR